MAARSARTTLPLFRHLVQAAIDAHVDFVLLAGDLFHKRTVEARTFVQTAF